MISTAQAVIKLRKKAEEFNQCYKAGNYARAKYIYDTCERVALFLEAEQDLMQELFGYSPEEDAAEPLFSQEKARKCYLECAVKADKGFEHRTYKTIKEIRTNDEEGIY